MRFLANNGALCYTLDMTTPNHSQYILISRGRVLAEGDDPQELLVLHDLDRLGGGVVKSWRNHKFIAGNPDSVFYYRHCEYCKAPWQRNGSNEAKPCKYPERSEDTTVEVIKYHAPHTDDRCCMEHKHHAKGIHVNCMMR